MRVDDCELLSVDGDRAISVIRTAIAPIFDSILKWAGSVVVRQAGQPVFCIPRKTGGWQSHPEHP